MLKDLGALVAPTVMAIMFVAVVVSILRNQNNSRRRARDVAAPGPSSPPANRPSGEDAPSPRTGQQAARKPADGPAADEQLGEIATDR